MEDLTHTVFARLGTDPITALSPSSMAGGNRIADTARQTMTAPGSDPVDPMPAADRLADPSITATAYDTPVVLDQSGAKITADNADRSDPYTVPGGSVWKSAHETGNAIPELTGRTMLRRGEWNVL